MSILVLLIFFKVIFTNFTLVRKLVLQRNMFILLSKECIALKWKVVDYFAFKVFAIKI